jgi:hypothetical protein
MTTSKAHNLLRSFKKTCERDGDEYMIYHLSARDNKHTAGANISSKSALWIAYWVMKEFNIRPETMVELFNEDSKGT